MASTNVFCCSRPFMLLLNFDKKVIGFDRKYEGLYINGIILTYITIRENTVEFFFNVLYKQKEKKNRNKTKTTQLL